MTAFSAFFGRYAVCFGEPENMRLILILALSVVVTGLVTAGAWGLHHITSQVLAATR
jgi:hypothetical protein